MSSLNRIQKKELELIKKKQIEQDEMDTGWIIIEKDGKIRKARPNEIPASIIDPRGGVSTKDGIPCKPKLDGTVRKRDKKSI